jgi:polyisoprenoid-binding protein YceI
MRIRVSMLTLAVALMMGSAAVAQTQTWTIDPMHSAAHFSVRHGGISTVRGSFTKLSGTVQYDPSAPNKTVVEASIDVASIDTGVAPRDNDLRGDSFFDVAKYPVLTFKSKRVEAPGTGKLKITGDLTIHGVTREVVLDVDGPEVQKDPKGRQHMGASATTKINRKDFGVNGAAMMVGDEVPITIDLELGQKTPAS